MIININANNDHFAVLGNRYFSARDWRFNWCQFVADVKENRLGFPVTVKQTKVSPCVFVLFCFCLCLFFNTWFIGHFVPAC